MKNTNGYDIFELRFMTVWPTSISVFGVIAHVLLIVAFIKDPLKCFRNSGTYLVGNLAISDLLICLITPFSRRFTSTWASVVEFIKHVSISVSIFTIAAISIDRFLMSVYPIKYRVLMKGKFIVVWMACTWIIFSVFSSDVFVSSFFKDVAYYVINFIATAVIIFSGVMYALTYCKLRKQSKNFALGNISNRQEQARVSREKHFLRTISFVACIQIVCIVPSSIFFNYHRFQNLPMNSSTIWVSTHILAGIFYLNFAVNPVLYVLRLPNYRKTFRLLYCCKSGRS